MQVYIRRSIRGSCLTVELRINWRVDISEFKRGVRGLYINSEFSGISRGSSQRYTCIEGPECDDGAFDILQDEQESE